MSICIIALYSYALTCLPTCRLHVFSVGELILRSCIGACHSLHVGLCLECFTSCPYCRRAGRMIEENQLVNPDDVDDDVLVAAAARDDVDQDFLVAAAATPRRRASMRMRSALMTDERPGHGGRRTRVRRHLRPSEAEQASTTEIDGSGGRVRHRRSAIGWIQAAVRLCDTGRSTDRRCRRVEVNDGRFHMSIKLEER